jgi:uncharacterized protein (DUF1330 family)
MPPVYVVVQLTIHDRERYDRYVSRFIPVIDLYDGEVVAVDDHPEVLQGTWDHDRVVLLSFPDRERFDSWASSQEYREIVPDRLASTEGPILLVRGFD